MKELKDRIKAVCLPHFKTTKDREAVIDSALVGWGGIHNIDLEGSPVVFTNRLVNQLLPLEQIKVVLEELKSYQGNTHEIDSLIAELEQLDPPEWSMDMDRPAVVREVPISLSVTAYNVQ